MQKQSTAVKNITLNLLDSMRGYVSNNREEVAVKLITLLILSHRNKLPNGIKLNKTLAENKTKWLELLESLQSSDDAQVQRVYSSSNSLENLPLPFLHSAINLLLKYENEALVEPAIGVIRTLTSTYNKDKESHPDFSVSLLAYKLLGNKTNQSIFVMSPASLPCCVIASNQSGSVYYETINQSGMIADALSIMSENRFEVSYSNALQDPSYTVSSNELKQFDYGVSFSPMGSKIPKRTLHDLDRYDRFSLSANKIETANILHLIKQCSQKFICSVTEGVLYSTMDKELRQHLVANGMLKAIISLPSGIWTGTSVKTSLLVVEPNGNNKSVRFVDVTDDEFIQKSSQRLISLNNLDKIVEYISSDKKSDFAITVSDDELLANEYDLDASRYILDPKEKKVKKILEGSETVTLDSIVRFERGLRFKPEAGEYTVLEVGASELNEIGDITPPTKEVQISHTEMNKSQSGFLQPNDIVLILKGSAGKVGLVPEDVPTEGNRRWMMNRSGIVIRTISNKFDPKALYAYLCSDVGQVQLSYLIKGANIPNISLKELKKIPVILPTLDAQQKAIDYVDKGREIQRTIQKLQDEQYARLDELWSL